MKIIHTADWHIGQTFFGYDRTKEHQFFLDWLAGQIGCLNADVLLISGDVFDVANPSAQAQRQFYRFLRKVTSENPGLQIVAIAGNHDSATRLETPVPLLEEMNVQIRGVVRKTEKGEIDTENLIVGLNDRRGKRRAWCMAVPYLRQGDYPPVETEGDPYQAGVKNMYDVLLEKIQTRCLPDEAIIAMGHLQAAGSRLSEDDSSERLIIGGLEGIPAHIFDPAITYCALGHIHREQQAGNRKEIHYAGSPLPMSFVEENYSHGVILLEINDGAISRQEKLEFTPLAHLLRVPRRPAPLTEVLKQLAQLPESAPGSPAPYLEVRVLLTEPEPALRSIIEEAVKDKQVRLTRVLPFYPKNNTAASDSPSLQDEELMDPRKILNLVYERKYQCPLPDGLSRLFGEALEESLSKQGEKL